MTVAPQRIIARGTIAAACAGDARWTELDKTAAETFVRRIERSCFEVTIDTCTEEGIDRLFTDKKFVDRYSAHISRVVNNLDSRSDVGSDYLVGALLAGVIDPYDIAKLTSRELCPDARARERAEIAERERQKTEPNVSRLYTCYKCGRDETIAQEYQSRASDEASTRSIMCVNCEYVWRQN